MNRYRSYFPKDETPLADGDGEPMGDIAFLGIQRRRDPSMVARGHAWSAINKRFDDFTAATRLGIRKMGWTNRSDSNDPGLVIPFGVVHGGGLFSDPTTGQEWIIVAADGGAWKMHENTTATPLALPPGVTLEGRVTLVQANNQMFMFRGEDLNWLRMETLEEGFVDPVIKPTPDPLPPGTVLPPDTLNEGNIRTPNAATALYLQNRLFVPYDRDLVFMSDILACEQGPNLIDVQRINQGSADALTTLFKFNDTTIIAAKENSIYVMANVVGSNTDISIQAYLDTITEEYGCVARRSFVQVGNDVWFLAHNRGIMSIKQTEQNKLQGVDVPQSYDIQPIVDRINWQYAAGAAAANWNNKVYFAVPLDDATKKFAALPPSGSSPTFIVGGLILGRDYFYEAGAHDTQLSNGLQILTESKWFTATENQAVITVSTGSSPGTVQPGFRGYNNAVIVYDLVNKTWSGYDTGDYGAAIALAVREWVKFHYAGGIRVGFVSDDGFFNLYEDGFLDMTGDAAGNISHHSILDELVTRGYGGSVAGFKRLKVMRYSIATWWPTITMLAQTDGVQEYQLLTPSPLAFDRTRYRFPFNAPPYVVSNVNDDYLVPGREDYSLALNGDTVDFKSGVDLDRHQETEDAIRLSGTGRYVQLIFRSSRGRLIVRAVEIEAHAGQRKVGTNA